MKQKIFFLFLITTLLAACSSGQTSTPNVPIQMTDSTPHSTPTPDPEPQKFVSTATIPVSTSTPKPPLAEEDRKSTRLNSSHLVISYAVFCLKKKINDTHDNRTHDTV